jgi:hypothetical protein
MQHAAFNDTGKNTSGRKVAALENQRKYEKQSELGTLHVTLLILYLHLLVEGV